MTVSGVDLHTEVQQLIARILKICPPNAGDLQRADVAAWDSLKHVEIVFALEDRYGVRFDESEFAMMSSTSAIVKLVQPRLGP